MKHFLSFLLLATPCALLCACQGGKPTTDYKDIQTRHEAREEQVGKLFGDDVFVFGDTKKAGEGSGIGVNAHLWRATLDTLSFMPLMLVDPFGGVILTDWYTPQNEPGERLKVDVRILTKELRSDGLKISVFRQKMVSGQWVTQSVSTKTQHDLEDAILGRARQLKSGHVH